MDRVQQLALESKRAQIALEKEEIELAKIEKQLTELNVKYTEAMEERQRLQDETELVAKRLVAADKLIGGLSSESERWKIDLESLHGELEEIVGNCLLSAGFLAYCAPFSYDFRQKMIYDDWLASVLEKDIPLAQPYTIESQLTNDVEISK